MKISNANFIFFVIFSVVCLILIYLCKYAKIDNHSQKKVKVTTFNDFPQIIGKM